jgi:hypothetical protein
MAAMLLVFTLDVAVAATCCPLDMNMNMGTDMNMDAGDSESTMSDGEGCPQSDNDSGQMEHATCCLSCVVMLPAWQFPELDIVAQSFSSPLIYVNPSSGFEPPYRPPITHLH